MKKHLSIYILSLIPVLVLSLLLSGCGKQQEGGPVPDQEASGPKIVEVKITGANFYDYFDYKEYPSYATDEDGNVNAVNLSYGFSLRDGYVAANDPEHKDTLQVSFTAEGVASYGEFAIDFQTLHYSGIPVSEERETVTDTLTFWPQGNRTVSYPYGTISTTYIIALRNFTVTSVNGSIYLLVG